MRRSFARCRAAAAVGLAAATCCAAARPACGGEAGADAGTHCHELTLRGALPAGRDVVVLVETRDGRVTDHGVMAAGEPETLQRLREPRWRLEGDRLSGPLAVRVGLAGHRMELDASLATGGVFRVHYGCPDPPREAAGEVTVEFPARPDEKRHVVWLQGAMGEGTRLGLILNLDRAARTLQAVNGWASNYNRGSHPLDVARLAFDGTRLEGEVGITVVGDGSVPAHGLPVEGHIRLTAALDAQGKAGEYAARFGIERTRSGPVVARPLAAAQMRTTLAELAQPVSAATPWRVWLATGPRVSRGGDGALRVASASGRGGGGPAALTADSAQVSALPPADWTAADYDDSVWGRYGRDLFEYMGGYGCPVQGPEPAVLCLRTRFGVRDPAAVTDAQVLAEYIGGIVVYVNGREVGRGHMPEGELGPHTTAADYPPEAYTADESGTPLPVLALGAEPEAKWRERYAARIRRIAVPVPAAALRPGANALAVELRRAPVSGPMPDRNAWSHLAVRSLRVQSVSGAGLVSWSEACRGTRVWSAQAVEQVTETPAVKSLLRFGWGGVNLRANGLKGIEAGNPYDPVGPVRILAPRNGVGNGQTVLCDPDGLRDVTARIGVLAGAGGAALPAGAVRVRFAAQGRDLHYCDELHERPPDGARTMPVWIEVAPPRDQPPGWYAGELALGANGRAFAVPVQALVTGFTVPAPRDFRSHLAGMHSPEAVAKGYGAPPWSDEHFRLMGRSLAILGRLGSDVMFVPVILDTLMGHESGLIRWVRTEGGYRPDFTLFEKYLDLYAEHCGPPLAIILSVWSEGAATEIANAYEGRKIASRVNIPKQALRVTLWDPSSGRAAPMPAPSVLDEGAESFWKPMIEGVRAIVTKRGWPERVVMLGTGNDRRPSQRTGERWREWAPWARWNLYSHFSGDPRPDPATGRLVAIGGLEIGLREAPDGWLPYTVAALENLWRPAVPPEFVDVHFHRCCWDERSGPMPYRTVASFSGRLTRVGVDYWPGLGRYSAPGMVWGTYPVRLAWKGPDGAAPTVRLQMVREALQDFEARMAILDRLPGMAAERREVCRQLLDDYPRRCAVGDTYLSQMELTLDWPAYVARVYEAAGEAAGATNAARWAQPPR